MQGERLSACRQTQVIATCACRRALLAALGCLFLAASGCTPWREYFANGFKVGPNYCPPPAAVAQDWIDSGDKRIHSDDADLSHWWTAFNDQELNDLIHAAYQQNLTLKEAGYRILQARAFLAIQIGEFFPQTQQAAGSWSRNSASLLAANQSFLPQQFFDNWNLGFNMAWELDFWGRFRRAIIAADADLDASVFDYDDVLVTLLGDVAATYVQIRTIQKQIDYVQQNIVIQKESLDIAKARFQGGLTSELDVEQATSQLAQTEALIPQFQIQLRQANDRLCVLLGIPTEDLVKIMGKAPIPTVPPDVVIGIPAQLLTRRPDIRRAERFVAAQCEQIGIAESNLYPQISITGSIAYDAEHFNQLFRSKSQEGTIGPSFRWNVLNYGRLVNAVRLQEAKYMELATHYKNVVLKANAEVEDGLVEFLQSQLEAKSMKESVDAAEKAVQLSIVQYRGGLTDFNRVALLEQNLVQQQDLYAQAIGDIAVGLVRTYRALGGGWEIRCNCGEIYETASVPPEAIATPGEETKVEELPPGTTTPTQPLPSKDDPKLKPTPTLKYPDSAVPKGTTPPELKPTTPGELIKPDQVPPRSAPSKLPDLGPDKMPDEDVFGPGKDKPKADEKKPPFFDQPNPPPANDVFGPAEIPSIQDGSKNKQDGKLKPGEPKPDEPRKTNEKSPPSTDSKAGDPKASDQPKPAEPAKLSTPPTTKRRPAAPWQVRPAGGQGKPSTKPRNPSYVQHAGLLPEDRGEVRRVR